MEIKKEEKKYFWILFAILTLIWTCSWIGNIIVQTLVVKRLGIELVPYTYIVSVSFSLVCTILYFRFKNKMDNNTLFFISLISSAILIFLSLFFIHKSDNTSQISYNEWIFFLLIFISLSITTSILLSVNWVLIGKVFRPSQQQRLLPGFAFSPLLGGILAGLIVQFALKLGGTKLIIIVMGILFVIDAVLLFKIYIRSFKVLIFNMDKYAKEDTKTKPFKFHDIFSSKIALVLLLIGFIGQFVSHISVYEITYLGNNYFKSEADLADFFSILQIASSGLVLVYLIIFKNKAMSYLGVFQSMLILPIYCVLGFGIMLYYLDLWTMFYFRLFALFFIYTTYIPVRQYVFGVFSSEQKGSIWVLYVVMEALAQATAGLIIIINTNLLFLTALAFLFSIVWSVFCYYGIKIYNHTLLSNLSNRELFFDTLESIEDPHNKRVNEILKNIMLDDYDEYTSTEKIKVVETIERLNNPEMIRSLSVLLENPDYRVRLAAVKALITIFKNVASNAFVYNYVFKLIKNILMDDPVDLVRALAAKFIFENTSKEMLPDIFFDLAGPSHATEARLVALRTLEQLKVQFVDLMQIEFLHDPNPAIQGHVAGLLAKYPEHMKKSIRVINSLLDSPNSEAQIAGIKALIKNDFTRKYLDKIKDLTNSSNKELRIYSLLAYARALGREEEAQLRMETLSEMIDLVSKAEELDELWQEEFVSLIIEIHDEKILDLVLDLVSEKSIDAPEQMKGLKHLARIMFKDLETFE